MPRHPPPAAPVSSHLPLGVDPQAVRNQLEQVLASPFFVNSLQLCRFLRHLVERTLAEDTGGLKESLLGDDVFERGGRYDPRIDPVVRVEARRLRAKLDDYYSQQGAGDPIVIRLPKGSYVPVFEPRSAGPVPVAPPLPAGRSRRMRWGIAAAALGVALVALFWFLRPSPPAVPRSVAVLPFASVGSDPDTEYFADGLTDELIDILGRTEGLHVVARSSVYQYKGRTGDARGIAKQLNANVLVEGSVRRQGSHLRITAQLVDAANGYQTWSQTVEREWEQVFSVQREIAALVAAQLRVSPADPRSGRYTANLESYNLYLKGRYYWNKRSLPSFQAAIAAFSQAIEKDSRYAPAWAGLADSYCMVGFMNTAPPMEQRQKAGEAVEKALELDDTLAEAHVAQGNIYAVYDWDWERAEQSYRRALQLAPDSPEAHYGLSKTLASTGRLNQGLAEMRRALELDPLSLMITASLAWELAAARQYDEAERVFQAARELDSNFVWTHLFHAWQLETQGDFTKAIEDLRVAQRLEGPSAMIRAELAYALGRGGKRQEAGQLLSALLEEARSHYISPFDLSRAYEGLGRRDDAMASLERAAAERAPFMVFLKVEPAFDSWRGDPRFQRLLKQMRLD